jgi:hypothetical protein
MLQFFKQARIHVLHVPALFELQNNFQGELSERVPDLTVVPIDHPEARFHCGRTRKYSCDTIAKLLQRINTAPLKGASYLRSSLCWVKFQALHATQYRGGRRT